MPSYPDHESPSYRDHDDVDHRFAFHPATSGEKRAEHDSFRGLCRELAHELVDRLPAGRERASALTNLEQVMFWGNAAIARALPVDAPERTAAEPLARASRTVLADREAELLEVKGPCSDDECSLHYAHRGPHDIRERTARH